MSWQSVIRDLVVMAPALLLSLTVHEYAHAWVATKLGDGTPVRQGRLTLSPVPHIDPLGTVVLPLFFLLSPLLTGVPSGMFFGWAKPVQFVPSNFTRRVTMWQGTALAAVAGPLSNLLLAALVPLVIRLIVVTGVNPPEFLVDFMTKFFQLNLLLTVFNLLPLPPLDGHHLFPRSMTAVKEALSRHSIWIFLGLFMLPFPGIGMPLGSYLILPVMRVLGHALFALGGLT